MVFGMGVNDSAFLKDNFTLHDRHIGYHSSCGTEQDSLIVTRRLRRGIDCDWGSLPHQTRHNWPPVLWFDECRDQIIPIAITIKGRQSPRGGRPKPDRKALSTQFGVQWGQPRL